MMELWPFTNFHDLNLDWIIKTMKTWVSRMTEFVSSITAAWNQMKDDWKDYQNNLNDQWQEFIDDTYQEQITEILEQHPEWVTTVMDGSLTYKKLVTGTLGFVTPEMFGAVGDGLTDDSAAIQDCLDNGHIILFGNKTYLVDFPNTNNGLGTSTGLRPQDDTLIIMNDAKIKHKANSTGSYNIFNLHDVDNVILTGGILEGEKDVHIGTAGESGYGIRIANSNNIKVSDMEIRNFWGDGIITFSADGLTDGSENVLIENCYIHDCRRQGISVVVGSNITIRDCHIANISGTAPGAGIDIEADASNSATIIENVTIDNCYIHDTTGASILVNRKASGVLINNCRIKYVNIPVNNLSENVKIAGTDVYSVTTYLKDLNLYNCKIDRMDIVDDVNIYDSTVGTMILYQGDVWCDGCTLAGFSDNNYVISIGAHNADMDIKFNNCKFKSTQYTTSMFVSNLSTGATNLTLKNCDIDLNATTSLHRIPFLTEFNMEGCTVSAYNTQSTFLKVGSYCNIYNLIGNIFKFKEQCTYFINADSSETPQILIKDNVINTINILAIATDNSNNGVLISCGNVFKAINQNTIQGAGASSYTFTNQYNI